MVCLPLPFRSLPIASLNLIFKFFREIVGFSCDRTRAGWFGFSRPFSPKLVDLELVAVVGGSGFSTVKFSLRTGSGDCPALVLVPYLVLLKLIGMCVMVKVLLRVGKWLLGDLKPLGLVMGLNVRPYWLSFTLPNLTGFYESLIIRDS